MSDQAVLDLFPDPIQDVVKAGYVEVTAANYRWFGWARSKTVSGTTFRNYELLNIFGDDPLLAELLDRLDSGDTLVDAGAHRGHYTVPALCSSDCTVFAFEPNPRAFGKLLQNLSANPDALDRSTVHCMNHGLSGAEQTVTLYRNYPFDGPSTVEQSMAHGEETGRTITDTVEVELRPLDIALPEQCSGINHLKIDVEGHEKEVLTGATGTITTDRPTIYLEVHGEQTSDLDWVVDQEYDVRQLAPDAFVCEPMKR